MTEYVVRYEVPGAFTRMSEPVEADTPRKAAEIVVQREDGPLASIIDALSPDSVLSVDELVSADEMTIDDLNENNE